MPGLTVVAIGDGTWVFVDEIQRMPSLLNEVHRFIEEKQLRFILTGSSARKLKRGGVNLLAGRALGKQLFPFVPEELNNSEEHKTYSLDNALDFGTLPLVLESPNKEETLKAYVNMYLKEEIKAEGIVRNLPGFSRFLPIAGLSHGRIINTSGIARDAGVPRSTINDYLTILEDTLLVFRVPAYEAKLRVRERKHPKLYWVDPGLVRGVNDRFGKLHPEEEGALFEGIVATILRANREYRNCFHEMYYWASASGSSAEVDFLVEHDRGLTGIEVKSSKTFSRSMLKGLLAIKALPGLTKRAVVYRGSRRMKTEEGILVLPFEDFCGMLKTGELFD
jgi:predicted AAA+ superfamily ATPase